MILSEHETNLMRHFNVWMENENAQKCYKELFDQKLMKETEVSIKTFFKQQAPFSTTSIASTSPEETRTEKPSPTSLETSTTNDSAAE
jgi:hypothetical protein